MQFVWGLFHLSLPLGQLVKHVLYTAIVMEKWCSTHKPILPESLTNVNQPPLIDFVIPEVQIDKKDPKQVHSCMQQLLCLLVLVP